jgi:hypothetical protein
MTLRQSLRRAYARGEEHGRRDAIQGCVLLATMRFGDGAGEWLLREMMSFSTKQGVPKVSVIEFPARGERGEVMEMRASLLAVEDDGAAMARVVMLAERVADIIGEIAEIAEADRYSLLWHVSLIRELAVKREGGITPGCVLPRFPQRSEDRACEDRDPPGAA